LLYPIYQYDDFEDEYEDEGIIYRRRRRFANPDLNKSGEFSNPNMRGRFPYPNYGKEEGYPSSNKYTMKLKVSSFSENFDIESFLD